MTEEEKQQERECKAAVTDKLCSIDLKAYALGQIDERLDVYARMVIDNPEGHNLYEQLALARFFDMLHKYEFRIDEAQRFIHLYEFLKFDGMNGRQRYKMTPVQVFQFCNVKGFYVDDTHRLIRQMVLMVPRKFGKTTEVTSLVVDDFLFGDTNAQAYTTATTYDQAKICFEEIKKVLRGLDPGLKRFKLNRETIRWRSEVERSSMVRCLSNNADKLDGLNASVVINDEYSQQDSADLKNVLTTSMGIRENPLVVDITTASDKPHGPFAQDLEGYKKVLKGELEDDRLFAHLFLPDVDDEEGNPATWLKVQPHLGVTVKESYYEEQWAKAQRTADNMKAFRTKLLNVFETGSKKTWINGKEIRDLWRDVDVSKLKYKPDCEVAVDLSVDNDFSAVSFYLYLSEEKKSHLITWYYFPEERLEKHSNKELYKRWAESGHLKICKGNIIDYQQIVNDILTMGKMTKILQIAFDPNKAQEFQNLLIAYGAKPYMHAYKQTNYYFTNPVQAIPRMMEQGVLTFDPNPITGYCFDNCILDEDRMGNCKPYKAGEDRKIDGAITCCMAIGVAMTQVR